MAPGSHETGEDALAALAGAALAGDRAATEELLSALSVRIGRYCRARVGLRHGTFAAADDVAQEALLAVCASLRTFRYSNSAFLPFAFGIARNKVIDHYRATGREKRAGLDEVPELADADPGPEPAALRAERDAHVRALLDTLTERQREVVTLRVALGYSAAETAELVGATPGAVRVIQHRAMRQLRARIAHCTDS